MGLWFKRRFCLKARPHATFLCEAGVLQGGWADGHRGSLFHLILSFFPPNLISWFFFSHTSFFHQSFSFSPSVSVSLVCSPHSIPALSVATRLPWPFDFSQPKPSREWSQGERETGEKGRGCKTAIEGERALERERERRRERKREREGEQR